MERLTERAEIDKCSGIWVKEGFAYDGKRTWFNGYDEGYSAISKCAEYEDLDEQGKMLILPCAVGDTVYRVKCRDIHNRKEYFVDEKVVRSVEQIVNTMQAGNFGKTVFLTREEAEAALKELCTSNGP